MKIIQNLSIFLFLFWFLGATAQNDSSGLNWSDKYHNELKQISKLEEQGQNRSAYIRANQVFDKAISDNNIPGIIGSINLLIRNIYRVEDDAVKTVLEKIGTTKPAHPVVSAVLDSYLAELLTQYYERNRYTISQTVESGPLSWSDIERWSSSQIERTIDSLYYTSVKAGQLKEISSENIKALPDEELRYIHYELRPRIYDLLQDRLVQYLQNKRLNWSLQNEQPDQHEVDLLMSRDLSGYLNTHNKTGRLYVIIQAYDQWEQSLNETRYGEAYLDILLKRILFVANYLDEKYLPKSIALLQSLNKNYPSVKNSLAIAHSLANLQYRQGDYATSLQTLQAALNQKTEKAYQNNIDQIRQLIRTIKAPELNVLVEEAYPSGQRSLTSIHFRNLDKVLMELYPLTEKEFTQWRFSDSREENNYRLIGQKNPTWKKTINLPESQDYKSHRTEVLIDRDLKKGAYALRYWYKKDTLDLSGIVLFQVTDLTLIGTSDIDNQKLYIMDRLTGAKVNGARVEGVTIIRYPKFKNIKIQILPEDGSGSFLPPEKQPNLYYKVSHGNDTYISPLTYGGYVNHHSVQPFRRTVLLTDRAVYKPGQTIHFKALTVLSRKLDSELLKNQEINLSLRNANGKEVWQKTYVTDEWGTVTGTVPIPVSGLKGNWSLQAMPSGQTSIQVEDYQRPNFEVVVPDSSINRVDSLIRLRGEARTYHGFPVQNGQGDIRVELQSRHWFYSIRPQNAELIYTGTFQTDEQGKFEATFQRVVPPESRSRFGSFYFYSIHITVQAPSGEIREVTKTIPLDPDQILVQMDYPTFQILDDLAPVKFSVRNALQEADSQQVKIQISRLDAPGFYKVDRHWAIPDQPLLKASEFQKRVKHLFYDHRASMDEWKELNSIKSWSGIIRDTDTLNLKSIIHQTGYYRILVTSMQGDTLSTSSFGVADSKRKFPIVHDAIEILASQQTAQPGEKISLDIYTPRETRGGKIIISRPDGSSKEYNLENETSIEIHIKEEDRGGIYVKAFGYLSNRFYEKSLYIAVPWTNKELDISGFDALSKLEVNTDTNLLINVMNHKGLPVNAEVAVAIYDASLDAYLPHDWNADNAFFKTFYSTLNLRNISAPLGYTVSSENNYWEHGIHIHPLNYPRLPSLEFGFGHILYSRRNNNLMDQAAPAPMESSGLISGFAKSGQEQEMEQATEPEPLSVQVRKDFAETLLFTGKVHTDSAGRVTIPFYTNDKAGRWKILVFAHSKDLSSAVLSHTFETYQDLLLESYLPAMVRQGDEMDLTFTLYNNAGKLLSGLVEFEMKPLFSDNNTLVYKKNLGFELTAGESTVLSLPVHVGQNETGPLIFTARVIDDAGKVWDATEEVVPVYPSVETIYDGNVLVLKEGENWSGRDAIQLLEDGEGSVTIRIVQNMYSELLKSIPYLQYPNPVTTDQYFKNGTQALVGQYITGVIPDFEMIYQEWKRKGELESRLAQNQDKKYVPLENTPWVLKSETGTEQMALLGLFFDQSHMGQVIESNLAKWAQSQNPDGGFPWIKDGPSSFFITVRFLEQWNKIKWAGLSSEYFAWDDYRRAQEYADNEFLKSWRKMKENSADSTIHYQKFIPFFVQRSYDFVETNHTAEFSQIWNELKDSIYMNWEDYTSGLRADIGIAAWHLNDREKSRNIVDAFIDNAIRDPKLGIYWRYNHQSQQNGYLAVLAKITELLVLNGESGLDTGINQWILVNKMTNDWQQNPHVTSLMLSLLKMKGDWTATSRTMIRINGQERLISGIGDMDEITLTREELKSFRVDHREGPPIWLGIITSKKVQPEDEITQTGDILHIEKIVTGSPNKEFLQVGEQLTIRLKLSTDRDLDYVYIEDPLIPGMDPGISLSGYQWKYGLSYYQSFNPASAQFYIQQLPRGEYILEYKIGVVRSGTFRNPRTKIQSYFVPEVNGFDQWKPVVKIGIRN